MVAELIDHIDVYPAEQGDMGKTQRIVIHYNCIGAFEVPDRRKIPETDGFSLEAQAAMFRHYAGRAGYTIVGALSEHSSGMTLDYPALQQVTQAVLAGKVDMVSVKDLSRIGHAWDMTQDYINLPVYQG